MTTIVSCYYLIPNNKKRSVDSYMNWIVNFLDVCTTPIVMFSDGEIADQMDLFRTSLSPIHRDNWRLIKRPIQELYYGSEAQLDYFNMLAKGRQMTPEVIRIWMNKNSLMKEVANQNPFNTESFIWCDAGAWRDRAFANQYAKGWPRKQVSAFTVSWVDRSLQEIRLRPKPSSLKDCFEQISPIVFYKPGLAGGIMGGSKDSISTFVKFFEEALAICIENKYHIDGDQEICAAVVLWMEHLGYPVDFYDETQPLPPGTDNWFILQSLL